MTGSKHVPVKVPFAALFLLCVITAARAADSDEREGSLLRYIAAAKLTPERAAKHAPADHFGYLRDEHEYTYTGSVAYQMHAESVFFAEYAKQLKTLTDQKNSAAAGARLELIGLLSSVSEFLFELDHHRTYDNDRIPAYAEWLLYSADPHFFQPHKGAPLELATAAAEFSTDEVRAFIKAIGFTRFEFTNTPKAKQMIDHWKDEILTRLTAFERHLNGDGRHHFRFKLFRFIDNLPEALYDRNGD